MGAIRSHQLEQNMEHGIARMRIQNMGSAIARKLQEQISNVQLDCRWLFPRGFVVTNGCGIAK